MKRIIGGLSYAGRSLVGSCKSSTLHSSVRGKLFCHRSTLFNRHLAAIIQNVILLLLAVPTYIAVFQEPASLSTSDLVLGALALIDLAVEFTADNQQYSFQTYKQTGLIEKNDWPGARIRWTPADAKRGFVTRGLWAWSRHPNFLCEQSFWVRSAICYPSSPCGYSS